MIRVQFLVQDRSKPRFLYRDLPAVPRRGDWVDMGDGQGENKIHLVQSVIWRLEWAPLETAIDREFEHDVRVEVDEGRHR